MTPDAPHLDTVRLADVLALLDGDPPGPASADDELAQARLDRVHVESCPACRSALRDLTAADELVRAALATVPRPALPAAVAARLAATARELARDQLPAATAAAATAAPAAPAATAATATVTDLAATRARREGRAARWMGVAAGVALVAVAGIGGAGLLLRDSGGNSTSSAGDAAGGSTALSAPAPTSGDVPPGLPGAAAMTAPAPAVASGTDYTQATLASAATSAAARTDAGSADRSAASGPATEAAPADPLSDLREPGRLAECLQATTGQPRPEVRLLDYAQFEGAPALVILLGTGEVYAVGPQCSAQTPDLLGAAQAG